MPDFADLVEALTSRRPAAQAFAITEAAIDSRALKPGALFVAIRGERLDGHDFVREAFQRGAVCALIEREIDAPLQILDLRAEASYPIPAAVEAPVCIRVQNTVAALQQIARLWRRKLPVQVVGITGSVGKSTTKELVAAVLSVKYKTLKSAGNLNNEIGLPVNVLQLRHEHQRAVLEMGFYVPGEIALLCDISLPRVGVITNVGTVHAERAGSQESIARGKAELVEALPEDGVAVLNYDDARVRSMSSSTKAKVFFYGLSPEADLWADEIESHGLDGIHFRLHHGRETLHTRIPLIGRHSVHTALRAAAVGLMDGLTWPEILNGLRQGRTQLRMAAVRSKNGSLILDDTYNASPESVLAALNLLEEMEGRKIAVLGDMLELGPYEREGHEMVGLRAAQVARVLLTLGVRAHLIAQAARKAGMKSSNILEFEALDAVVKWLEEHLAPTDTVLIKGSHGLHMDRITAALELRS